jgi:hypothetical protein
MFSLSEVRLYSSPACRAWSSVHGCFSATEWESQIESMGWVRHTFEAIRFKLSAALSVEGIDPLGIVRRLLIHESVSPLSRSWLREVGFVHLEAASGIHLYALWRALEFFLERVSGYIPLSQKSMRIARTVLPLAIWFAVFGMAGFRPGLVRPLGLVLMRWGGRRFGFRWSRAAPILIALTFDAGIGFFSSFGSGREFSEWAPGELHYAAAWWGGILGYEWARARGLGAFSAHAALSFASWITVLPLDLAHGQFAPFTPILSLLTVEFLVRGGYLLLLAGVFSPLGLQWVSLFLNRGIALSAEWISRLGAVRSLADGYALALALGIGFLLFAVTFTGESTEKWKSRADA